MKRVTRFAWLVPLTLLAVSCGGDDAAERKLPAGGEILERSISDDMLPYDTVRSRPPLAETAKKDGGAGASEAGTPGSSAAPEGIPAPDDEAAAGQGETVDAEATPDPEARPDAE